MNETNLSLKYLIDQLHKEQTLTKEEWITLIEGHTPELSEYLFSMARGAGKSGPTGSVRK